MTYQEAIAAARAKLEVLDEDTLVSGLQEINAKLGGKPIDLKQYRTLEAMRTVIIGILGDRAADEFTAKYAS
jgi:hypothetical protein